MTDRQTDDRQTENSNPSVPYDTFACFACLIKRSPFISIFTAPITVLPGGYLFGKVKVFHRWKT